jgi:hypothetical protein
MNSLISRREYPYGTEALHIASPSAFVMRRPRHTVDTAEPRCYEFMILSIKFGCLFIVVIVQLLILETRWE